MGRRADARALCIWAGLVAGMALASCHGRPEAKSAGQPEAKSEVAARAPDLGPASLAGRYVRVAPAWAEMTISQAPGGRWRVSISGTSDQEGASGAPAECETVAVGRYATGRLTADLVPFSGDNIEMTAEDVKARPGQMVLETSRDRMTVERSDGDQYCGMGSDLTGRYVRSDKTVDEFYREQEAKHPTRPEPSDAERRALGESRRRDMEAAWAAASRPENAKGSCRDKIGERPALALANLCRRNALIYSGGCEPTADCSYLQYEAGVQCKRLDKVMGADASGVPCGGMLPWEDWDIYQGADATAK